MSGAAGIVVWMLVFHAGSHEGYIVQGDIVDQSACYALAESLKDAGAYSTFARPWYRCVSYARAYR